MARKLSRLAIKVALGYAVIAALWILLSDRVLEHLVADPEAFTWWSTAKGWFFVAVTAGLLYAVLRRELRRADSEAGRRADVEKALRESESRFRLVVETIDEIFWIRDPGKRQMLYVSPGFERIWGRSRAELYANPGMWIESIVAEDRERVREASEAGQTTGDYDEEFRIQRPDGELRWIHSTAFPVCDADGNVTRIVGVAQDISSRKRLEKQFLHAQRLESIGTLAGGVAHDLNNILAPILMASSLLKQRQTDSEDLKVTGMIEAAAQRGAGIIRQLLTFSRGVEGEKTLVQVRHLLKETVEIIRETFPRNIAVTLTAPGDLWPVRGDATLLHQIFMNLCVNARDAMKDGGKLLILAKNMQFEASQTRDAGVAESGPYIVISVIDTGEGIPADNLARIFDPFFTTKTQGRGTGLGLSTTLGIVKSHGGYITVESQPGQGSEFRVHLPAAPDEVADSSPPEEVGGRSGHGEQILVVDDEADVLETSRRVLEKGNFRVCTAGNGEEALKLFLQHRDRIRLVVLDVMMPVMDGPAFVRALRPLDANVPIIATSGLHDNDKTVELRELGISTVLAKPFSAVALSRAVVTALEEAGRNGTQFAG